MVVFSFASAFTHILTLKWLYVSYAAARAARASPSQLPGAEMGKKRCKTPVGTQGSTKVTSNPTGGKVCHLFVLASVPGPAYFPTHRVTEIRPVFNCGQAASKKGTGPADGGQVVPVTLEQLKEKIKDLEIQQKRKPGNKRQDPVYAEIALLKTTAPVEVDEEVALASFMDVIEDGQMDDDEKCTKIRELCARQGAEVQR